MTSKCVLLWLCWWSAACAACRLCPGERPEAGLGGCIPQEPLRAARPSLRHRACGDKTSAQESQGRRGAPGLRSVCIFRGGGWLTQSKDCQHPIPLGGSLLCPHGSGRPSQLDDPGAAGGRGSGPGLSLHALQSLAGLSAVAGKEDWQDFSFLRFTVNWFVA